jgi:hypothetical protein
MTLYELRLIVTLLIRSIKISLNIITAYVPASSGSDEEHRNTSLRCQLPVNYCKAPTVSRLPISGVFGATVAFVAYFRFYARLIHTEDLQQFTLVRKHLVSTTPVCEAFTYENWGFQEQREAFRSKHSFYKMTRIHLISVNSV